MANIVLIKTNRPVSSAAAAAAAAREDRVNSRRPRDDVKKTAAKTKLSVRVHSLTWTSLAT